MLRSFLWSFKVFGVGVLGFRFSGMGLICLSKGFLGNFTIPKPYASNSTNHTQGALPVLTSLALTPGPVSPKLHRNTKPSALNP